MSTPKFHVAICGGGIGGLAAAVALAKYPDITVDIYESAPKFSEVGAGIGVWPRVWKTLAKLGIDEELAEVTALKPTNDEVDTFIFRKADQPQGLDFYKLVTQGSFIRYHRPDFLQVLVSHIPPTHETHFLHRLQTYNRLPSGKIELVFDNGVNSTCDILIGADGIRSNIRRKLLTEQAEEALAEGRVADAEFYKSGIKPHWTGIVAYRALIPTERLAAYRDAHADQNTRVPDTTSIPIMYMGQHVNVVVYPISKGKMINVAAFHAKEELAGTRFPGPWVTNVGTDDLLATHADWEAELRGILECVEKPSRWAIHVVKPLRFWVKGSVALLGDAAHAMSPQQASGAGQAIEDAYILATLLGHPLTTMGNIDQVLEIYDTIRRPMATEVQERSLLNGRLFGLQLPGLDSTKEFDRLPEIGDAIKANWSWAWSTTLDKSADQAVCLLQKSHRVDVRQRL